MDIAYIFLLIGCLWLDSPTQKWSYHKLFINIWSSFIILSQMQCILWSLLSSRCFRWSKSTLPGEFRSVKWNVQLAYGLMYVRL